MIRFFGELAMELKQNCQLTYTAEYTDTEAIQKPQTARTLQPVSLELESRLKRF